ncbi:MAG: hypothetical protein HFG07_04950 [Oscillibacter sp.]|nr:hypothetical protein [Oscillibacter sp.]
MQAVIHRGKNRLYSYTRTSETRTVEDDNPEDMAKTKEETLYIYTLACNGESYFTDTAFRLTDDQRLGLV